ncbi:phosphatase PAP2 family protein [Duffyella gerundensis]|nr:phosphatase PAP2 family protein [Duffyella gerundensis]UCB32628.1 phosphatase PAP2 family protein [Duffyella gerundensis]
MRLTLSVIALSLFASTLADAAEPQWSQIHATAVNTTADLNPNFAAREAVIQQQLIAALRGNASSLQRSELETARQSSVQADTAWLQASGYDFHKKENQQAGIALLSQFSAQPKAVMTANLDTVESINLNATGGQRRGALIDAEGQNFLYFLADAMGPDLGKAFLTAYNKGELSKAAALIKASEVSTSAAKKHFNYPRPFLVAGNSIHNVPDDAVVKDNQPYRADGGSFPSGHTNTGYTDALLMAEMLPERFVPLLDRGARYGYSRIVLGVHYPLDVIGSRMAAERNVAHFMNDAAYRTLFEQAKQELRGALEKECGMSLAACARTTGDADPYAAPQMRQFYRFTMTYGLPRQRTQQSSVQVPAGAEVLLEAPLPQLNAAQRRQLMVSSALAAGYPLSGDAEQSFWQRLNLHDAVVSASKR